MFWENIYDDDSFVQTINYKNDFKQSKDVKILNLFEWSLKYFYFNFTGIFFSLLEGFIQCTFVDYLFNSEKPQLNNFMNNDSLELRTLRHEKRCNTKSNSEMHKRTLNNISPRPISNMSKYLNSKWNIPFQNFIASKRNNNQTKIDKTIIEFAISNMINLHQQTSEEIEKILTWFFSPFFSNNKENKRSLFMNYTKAQLNDRNCKQKFSLPNRN